ncbi:MAG: hypothetical protein GKS02_07140 [Alphaproteobacteria bacterium]|nr:hypothetical protein [Alphaproteobacteria bacterium]
MHKLILAAAFTASFAISIGVTPASADPQMLGIVQTVSAVPLHCSNGECGAELTSICLQEERVRPMPGQAYFPHDPNTVGLTGIRRDGSRIAILVEDVLKFSSARGYSSVRVSLSKDVLRQYDVASVELSIDEGLTLIPETGPAVNADSLTEGDIELGAGRLRQTATVIVDQEGDKADASQVLARMIDNLPRHGRANFETRSEIWSTTGVPVAQSLSTRGSYRARLAYNGCYRKTRFGDQTLRECLGLAHDDLIQDLNDDYWEAVKTGT